MHTIENIFNFSFFLRKTIMNDQKSLRFICIIENRHTCAKEGMHARRHASSYKMMVLHHSNDLDLDLDLGLDLDLHLDLDFRHEDHWSNDIRLYDSTSSQ